MHRCILPLSTPEHSMTDTRGRRRQWTLMPRSFESCLPRPMWSTRNGPEAEEMGQTELASQFVSGLRPELKSKLVGAEGKLDQLVHKTRFKEAKRKEFTSLKNLPPPKRPGGNSLYPSMKGRATATTSRGGGCSSCERGLG